LKSPSLGASVERDGLAAWPAESFSPHAGSAVRKAVAENRRADVHNKKVIDEITGGSPRPDHGLGVEQAPHVSRTAGAGPDHHPGLGGGIRDVYRVVEPVREQQRTTCTSD
jgi:hypothetical protein